MAEAIDSNPPQPKLAESEEEKRLKYLDFVQVVTLNALMKSANLYSYAKDNSGPLKSRVNTVEATVKTVVAPVYDKFHDVPIELLKFVYRKVDESMTKLPPTLKHASAQAFTTATKAPAAARSALSELKNTGVVGTASGLAKTMYAKCEPTAKDLYTKYEPV